MIAPRSFVEAEAALAASLPAYESRPQQRDFAEAIERALGDQRHLLAEAGCGTGKSLGYLIPAILSGQRVVISTATRALQDQVVQKDLPFLAEHLGVPFTFAVLKGRSNYACHAKMTAASTETVPALAEIMRRAEEGAADWFGDGVAPGHLGERDVFGSLVENDAQWRALTSSTDECPGKKECPFSDQCFAEKAKAKAAAAQIVVVNHALYFTDLLVREMTGGMVSMLGQHDLVIFDEAHEVEDYATSMLGTRFTVGTFVSLASQARNYGHKVNDDKLVQLAEEMSNAAHALFNILPTDTKDRRRPRRVFSKDMVEIGDEIVRVIVALNDMATSLRYYFSNAQTDAEGSRVGAILRRTTSARGRLQQIVTDDWDTVVRWVEVEADKRNGDERKVLCATMIHLGNYLSEHLWATTQGILVSATLSTDGNFDYVAGRLGLTDFESVDVGTPFDFGEQALLYVPRDLVEPGAKTREQWEHDVIDEIERLVMASDGRALLLFTSRKQMNATHAALASKLPYTVLKQGDLPNGALVERFKEDTHSVLFAVKSFFTGVDVQGESLSLVVIDKLPFPTPDEPVIQARVDQIEDGGGNGFRDFTIPFMSLTLKQGFGRLVRHRNDTGVVAILDSRLVNKGYGKRILRSLPPAGFCDEPADVEGFFKEVAATA